MDDHTQEEKLHLLNTMVLTDEPRDYGFPIYPFTETPDNEISVLLRSEELLQFNKMHKSSFPILLTDNLGGSEPGYQGAERWISSLCQLRVRREDVTLVPFTGPSLNTLTEAITLVDFLRQKKWGHVVITAPPFHALRCFLSMVTAVNKINPGGLRVYSKVAFAGRWNEHVVHSQKTVKGARKDVAITEFRNLQKYQKEGIPFPLISTDGALAYLEWRDSQY